jgi:hypothetical protein
MDTMEIEKSRRRTARWAAAWYVVLAMAMVPDTLRRSLFVAGDAVATGRNLIANALSFRASVLGDLVTETDFLFLALALYGLLKDVGRVAARTMLALVLLTVALAISNMGSELTALDLFQRQEGGLAMDFLEQYHNGAQLSVVFMGLWMAPFGWLVFKSGFMPKLLGIILMVGSSGYLVKAVAGIVFPDSLALASNAVLLSAIPEFATIFWLFAFGFSRPRPAAVARAS